MKMVENIMKFDDIEIKKYIFHQNKSAIKRIFDEQYRY